MLGLLHFVMSLAVNFACCFGLYHLAETSTANCAPKFRIKSLLSQNFKMHYRLAYLLHVLKIP